jgi:GntR family transcriptional regulator/MocR family aminotransferase
MSESWANPSVDLFLDLRGIHRRSGIEAALREAVHSGRLTAGTPLPSSRALAAELGIARNTVADAYGQLVAEGWLTARPGSGTRVGERVLPLRSQPKHAANGSVPRFNLSPGEPDLAGFPRSAWQRAARQAMTVAPNAVLGYPDPRGPVGLRQTLVDYLARVRGVRTTADRIMICSGFVQAISLLATTLHRNGGRTVAVESHGLGLHREVIRAAGPGTWSIPIDGHGARTDQLDERDDVAAVLLTPAHQFPLGVALSAERRAGVLRWARTQGTLVIEDDYDGEFRYDRKPVGALQGLAPDLVAYIGTTSKSLAPGLGLAWLVMPPHLVDEVMRTKRLSDGFTGVFEQLTLAEFIANGSYDRHVRRSRLRYRRRRDELIDVLQKRNDGRDKHVVPGNVTGIAAGLHAVVNLPDHRAAEEEAIITRARRAGLRLLGLGFFREEPTPEAPAALVIGYARPPDHAFSPALETLIDILPRATSTDQAGS